MLKVVQRAAAYCEQRYQHGAARLWISTVAITLLLLFSVLYGVALILGLVTDETLPGREQRNAGWAFVGLGVVFLAAWWSLVLVWSRRYADG